jgi:hypothetical protein
MALSGALSSGKAGGFKNSEPLKAAAGALSRPRKTIVERWYRMSWPSAPQVSIRTRATGFGRFAELHCAHRIVFTGLSHSTFCSTVNLRATYCGSCQTFAASPAEPGVSQRTSVETIRARCTSMPYVLMIRERHYSWGGRGPIARIFPSEEAAPMRS